MRLMKCSSYPSFPLTSHCEASRRRSRRGNEAIPERVCNDDRDCFASLAMTIPLVPTLRRADCIGARAKKIPLSHCEGERGWGGERLFSHSAFLTLPSYYTIIMRLGRWCSKRRNRTGIDCPASRVVDCYRAAGYDFRGRHKR